jgi:hypothetical protein
MIVFPYIPLMITEKIGESYCLDPKTDEKISLKEYYKRHGNSGWYGLKHYNSDEELEQLIRDEQDPIS